MAPMEPPSTLKLSGSSLQEPTTICIPQSDYESLVKIANQYVNLRRNLLRGGVDEETIALLSRNESRTAQTPSASQRSNPPAYSGPITLKSSEPEKPTYVAYKPNFGNHQHGAFHPSPQKKERSDWTIVEPYNKQHSRESSSSMTSIAEDTRESNENINIYRPPAAPRLERLACRTILLLDLSTTILYEDVVAAIRGGQLLDVYLRRRDRSAKVSFVYEDDAKAFYDHARNHGIYIKSKRIEVRWADRHANLAGHVFSMVKSGATRNLIILRCNPSHTEDSIRDDLEHIHGLVVVKVEFVRGSCFINTNSIQNALYARNCMMSRLHYKSCRIDWGADECAEPLPQMPASKQQPAPPAKVAPTKTTMNPLANRFQALNPDDNGIGNKIGIGSFR